VSVRANTSRAGLGRSSTRWRGAAANDEFGRQGHLLVDVGVVAQQADEHLGGADALLAEGVYVMANRPPK